MFLNLMMRGLAIVISIGALLCSIVCTVNGVSVSCMMAYEEGGAPAVFSSPECPEWVISAESSGNSTRNCQFATLQGRREYQEDRVTCNLDMKVKLPFSGEGGIEEITIGIAAIFDGHGGQEASEMVSIRLSDYFFMHVVFTAYKQVLLSSKENYESNTIESTQRTQPMFDHHSLLPILEEALLRSIQDIDSEFSKEAFDKGYISGSTGTIVLFINGRFLVANVGDSKAILCSQKALSDHDAEGASLRKVYAEELTRDHHPDREDEKARIEASGGFVTKSSIPRVNGVLAVSRAIGDVYLKRYGVIAEPEITSWRHFTPENIYLVVASDGVFETLTPLNVCDLLHDKASDSSFGAGAAWSLPQWIVRHAFRTGSTDNLSAIVVSDLHKCTDGMCDEDRKLGL